MSLSSVPRWLHREGARARRHPEPDGPDQLAGQRQVLAVERANRQSRSSWKEFRVRLKERDLSGVEFVVSDDHAGLKRAIGEVLMDAAWQRGYVHFLRNALDYLPRQHHKHMKRTNMLERLNEEIKRRTRLVRALCVETHEAWLEDNRYLDMRLLAEQKKALLKMAA